MIEAILYDEAGKVAGRGPAEEFEAFDDGAEITVAMGGIERRLTVRFEEAWSLAEELVMSKAPAGFEPWRKVRGTRSA